ncbi:MAG: class I adenylate-forming enzyme family protein [Bacteroidota bacterium]
MDEYKSLKAQLTAASLSASWDDILLAAKAIDKVESLGMTFAVESSLKEIEQLFPHEKVEKGARKLRQALYCLEKELEEDTFEDLSQCVARHAKDRPKVIAIKDDRTSINWEDFDLHATQVANKLLDLGMNKAKRVGVIGHTCHEFLEIFIGSLRAGLCIVPLSTLASPETLKLMGEDAGIHIWFVSEKYKKLVEPFEHELEHKISFDFEAEGWMNYEKWRDKGSREKVEVTYNPSDEFDIMYSSGTTGIPKGIVHTRGGRHSRYSKGYKLGFWTESISLISTPLYSNTTMVSVLRTLAQGGQFILMKKFREKDLLEVAEREKTTHAVLVPVQLQRLLAYPDFDIYDLRHFELVMTTSAPLSVSIKQDMVKRWPGKFIEIYGLTEGGPITVLVTNDHPDKLHTVGQTADNSQILVIDEEGKEVPRGTIGELIGISNNIMAGYHNRPKATKEAFGIQLYGKTWFRSGDYGAMDEEGFITLHGRKKETIISGGFNIYAVDLEEMLKRHEAVKEAAVFGIPSERWGETPMALVEIIEGKEIDTEELLSWANERLGKAQRIQALETREELARSPIGKVLKKVLKKPYWEE